jgi:hypothetical protein
MKMELRVREAHGVFWPQYRNDGDKLWLGYRSCLGAADINFPTLDEAKTFIRKYETKGEIIHPYP